MKKVFYDSALAKIILFPNYSTITLFAWVFTKYKTLKQSVINHESTHVRQWSELTMLSALLLWLGLLMFGYSAWYLAFSVFSFYVWYLLEYSIRRIIGLFSKGTNKQLKAYRMITFEQEARLSENYSNYLENTGYFAWLKFYFKKKE